MAMVKVLQDTIQAITQEVLLEVTTTMEIMDKAIMQIIPILIKTLTALDITQDTLHNITHHHMDSNHTIPL